MKWFNSLSIAVRLTLVFIVVIFLATMAAGYFSYSRTFSTTNAIVEDSSKEINKQIILNYENYVEDITSLTSQVTKETTLQDITNLSRLSDTYYDISNGDVNLLSIALITEDGDILATSEQDYIQEDSIVDEDWFQDSLLSQEYTHYSAPHKQDVYKYQSYNVISVSKAIDYTLYGVDYTGVLLLNFDPQRIYSLADQTNLGENGHIVIISDTDELIYASYSKCYITSCDSVEWTQNTIIGSGYTKIDENDLYASINTIHGTRWRIATFVDVNIIASSRTNMVISMTLVLVSTLVLSIIIIIILARQITRPLNQLTKHMQEIESDHYLHGKVDITGQKEVVILGNTYNQMIEEMRSLLDRLVDEQKAKRKSEFLALQTQINPHFLYNTLDSIVWLSENNRNEDVSKMVIALSRFFRISISRGKNIIPIEKEIEHAKNYLLIQKIRYVNKFEYSFDIDSEVYKYAVVKLILQPLIENAINHGISKDDDGIINIKGEVLDANIVFTITNNGYGLTDEQIEDIYRKISTDSEGSFGLRNVYQRLKLYYGDEAELNIESIVDESTSVIVIIPKQEVYK